ncbi:uncharacterized protein LOC106513109 [Austrofundulus limnaeus]|uniref:Uncharacterized protein LOC106513109 n=1 Tax=Austrofundulus limnaeus TaxID=52670 RepID=A0A2I4AP38_AUSLI|nr:PREDICTED: uncharacterized protein LOC106513109 [Austrofundulus limnaeus]
MTNQRLYSWTSSEALFLFSSRIQFFSLVEYFAVVWTSRLPVGWSSGVSPSITFPLLRSLCQDAPWCLPTRRDLLSQSGGTDLAPQSSPPQAVGVATGRLEQQLTGYSDSVSGVLTAMRTQSPVWCPLSWSFFNLSSIKGRSPSTLKVYVAALSSNHAVVDGGTIGSHNLVSLFLSGARRLHPPTVLRAPAWDLPLVLEALRHTPFKPLLQADLKWLSCKTAFLLAIVSAKRVGELHALSASPSCLKWAPDGSGVTLWPNTAFVPKVFSHFHCNQPLRLARFPPTSGGTGDRPDISCPVRALETYIAATAPIRRSDQLFLCYGGPRLGHPLSKQCLSHWIMDVICHAYRAGGCEGNIQCF